MAYPFSAGQESIFSRRFALELCIPANNPMKVKPSQRFLIRGKLLGVLRLYARQRK
jgi:hypothetical protein